MNGHIAIELLSSYLDEEVTPKQLRLVTEHLHDCPKCRQTLDGLSSVAAGVRRLESIAPPPALGLAVERRLRLAVSEESRRPDPERFVKHWIGQPILAPGFAVILALAAIVYLFAHGVASRQERPTRVVVASMPAQEVDESVSFERVDAPAAESPALDDLGAGVEPGGRNSVERDARVGRLPAESAAVELRASAPTEAEGAVREIAGRTFVLAEGIWIERGLEDEVAAEIVNLGEGPSALDADLAPYSDLGRARLRIAGRIVEVAYGEVPPPR